MNCGVEFNDNEYRFGPCATKVYNQHNTTPSSNPLQPVLLTHLINILNYNLLGTDASGGELIHYFRLPQIITRPVCETAKGFALDGQIIYVSNVGTNDVVITSDRSINNINNAQILIPGTALSSNPTVLPQTGILFIAIDGNWYTLLS